MLEKYRSSGVILDVVNQVLRGWRIAWHWRVRSAGDRQAAGVEREPGRTRRRTPGQAHVWQVRAHEMERGGEDGPGGGPAVERVRGCMSVTPTPPSRSWCGPAHPDLRPLGGAASSQQGAIRSPTPSR